MIYVADTIMGGGKSSAAINYMNQHKYSKHFLYITPYLSEVNRIKECCGFSEPININDTAPKIVSLKSLLKERKNIVTTHALFHYFDDEILELCRSGEYILFMDEVINVIEQYPLRPVDVKPFFDSYTNGEENTIITWKKSRCNSGTYEELELLCNHKCIASYKNAAVIQLFPIDVIKSFYDVYVLTYMFQASLLRCYFDFYNINYEKVYVGGNSVSTYHFTDVAHEDIVPYNFGELIHVEESSRMNKIGDDKHALSKTRLESLSDTDAKTLINNMENYFKKKKIIYKDGNFVNATTKDALWTTFLVAQDKIKGKGYTKGFLPLNARATNEWRDRTAVAYIANVYFNPVIKNFLLANNISVDEDGYALSEMVQFIWRSGIRDGKHISVYIPSKRMRTLFINFIKEISK